LRRTTDGWKFTERVYDVRYLDHSRLAGSGCADAGRELAGRDVAGGHRDA
jgi:hypothetical protein